MNKENKNLKDEHNCGRRPDAKGQREKTEEQSRGGRKMKSFSKN